MNTLSIIKTSRWAMLVLGCLFFLEAKPLFAQSIFDDPIQIPSQQNGPTSVTVADIDLNDVPDIIVSSLADNQIKWYGQYITQFDATDRVWGGPNHISNEATQASQVVSADVNGDGLPDVIWASPEDNRIAWQESSSQFTGVFVVPVTISDNAAEAQSVYATDLDGDGDVDVLSASAGDDKIAWYQNDGDGNFSTEKIISSNANTANFVIAKDLDADGDLDVISASGLDDKIAWYQNDGDGNFSTEKIISTNLDQATAVFSADFDGDGYNDIAAIGVTEAVLFKNNGSSVFGEKEIITSEIAQGTSITGGDFDQDGDVDLVTVSSLETFTIDYSVAWYQNDGDGNFGGQIGLISSNDPAYFALVEDMDQDNFPDLIVASLASDNVQLFTNNLAPSLAVDDTIKYGGPQASQLSFDIINEGYGTLEWRIEWIEGGGNFYSVTESGDENTALIVYFSENETGEDRIGKFNVVSDHSENGSITLTVIQSKYLQTEIFGEQLVLSDESAEILDTYPIDIDGDGDMDILTAESTDNEAYFAWYKNEANQYFRGKETLVSTTNASVIHSDDMDGDGDNDLIIGTQDGVISLYKNNGNMDFGTPIVISTSQSRQSEIITADLDNDGDMDIIAASTSSAYGIYWFENAANTSFSAKKTITTSVNGTKDITVADLDEDGDLDVISASSSDDKVAWYRNDGDGDFGTQIVLTFSPDIFNVDIDAPNTVQANDFDRDGDLDIVVGSSYYPRISYLENTGDATFPSTPKVITSGTGGIYDISINDFDFDGDPDIAAVSTFSDEVSVLLNDGDGSVSSNTVLTENINDPTKVFAVDLDSDGDVDILVSSSGDNKLMWHKNLTINAPTSNETELNTVTTFVLNQNYPNPFNPTTNISFELATNAVVHLKIYNLLGKEMGTIVDGKALSEGLHSFTFNATGLTSGVYFYQLQAGGLVSSKKMTLIK